MNRPARLALPILAAALIGCSPDLAALTVPPPGAVAELDNVEESISLTRGIALGFECTYQGRPCEGASAEVEDPAVASVHAAYVDLLSRQTESREAGGAPRSVFVLVGAQPGTTTLTLTSEDGDLRFDVEILER